MYHCVIPVHRMAPHLKVLHLTHVILPLLKPKIWVRVNKVKYILTRTSYH